MRRGDDGRAGDAGAGGWRAPFDPARFGSVAESWEGDAVEAWRARWEAPGVVVYHSTTSTNDVARALAEAGAPEGTVVLAEEQSAGRGRAGRRWHAPPASSLLLSVVVRPGGPLPPATAPLRAGLAVAFAVERIAGVSAGIEWPNDVVLHGRKVAGILCEAATGGPGGPFVVIGIGLNVRQRPEDFPPGIADRATSLAACGAGPLARGPLAGAVLRELRALFAGAGDALEPRVLEEIRRRDALFGHYVEVDGVPAGTACGIAPDGALILRTEGRRVRVHNGTVRIRHDAVPGPG